MDAANDPLRQTELVRERLRELNREMGADGDASPYPGFAATRAKAPIVFDHHDELPDGTSRPVFNAFGWEANWTVLNEDKFSSAIYAERMGPLFGHSIIEMDEPEHRAHRSLLKPVLSRPALERLERELVTPTVDQLIGRFAGRHHADLVEELCFPYPAEVIAALMSVPIEDLVTFQRLAIEINGPTIDWDRAVRASLHLKKHFEPAINARREGDEPDLISVLSRAEIDGRRLEVDEVLAFLRLMTPAGADTPYRLSASLLLGLLTHPDQLEAVRADRSLVTQAIEEAARWECPLLVLPRCATHDAKVCGLTVPAGSVVYCFIGAANHDPQRWTEPERFDIFRVRRPNLGFGGGAHACVGAGLARMEIAVLVNAVLDALPGLRLDPARSDHYISGITFRAPERLDVVWD